MKPPIEDHRVRSMPGDLVMNAGMRGKCCVCGLPFVELPTGMKVHAGGVLSRPRTDVPLSRRGTR